LKQIRLVTLLVCFLSLLLPVSAAATPDEYAETRLLMGTTVEIKVEADHKTAAQKAVAGAFAEIARLEAIFSVYNPNSEISLLNKNGSGTVSPEVIAMVQRARHFSELSGGAFDISVLPMIELWRQAKKNDKLPEAAEIAERLKVIGWQNIQVQAAQKRIAFAKPGMKLDFGGIVKGYAVDQAVSILKKEGIRTGMVNAGGDLRCFGSREWRIALQNPRDPNDFITILKVRNRAVTTSGDYERYFIVDHQKISHILNPRTGYPAELSISATIVTENATDADALATAAFVLGPEKALAMMERYPKAECLVIDAQRKIHRSKGLGHYE
jgi:thiamine biosynthesis lipoprotein